ncbi:MAG: hypothetical protein CMN44_08975 [SAR116 cluster bacterium]|nr:hypothetical protein [SAR116 cluster bacterium]RPH08562.1 MAG: hypothetical protein CBC14_008850 [Alphaproteobacteria bacterium TMED54]
MKPKCSEYKNKFYKKSVCIISDCFIPTRNSASGMIYNLSRSLLKEGALVTCIHSGQNPEKKQSHFKNYDISGINFITTNFLDSFRNKNIVSRFFFEICLSLILSIKVIRFYKQLQNNDLVIWYGPSAFLWLPTFLIKKISNAPTYYILRDIFPDWLRSIGLIKNNTLFKILHFLSYPQYLIPNKIGVESPENLKLLKQKLRKKSQLEVLYNWPSINSKELFILKKRKEYSKIRAVYTGNFGSAQDANNVLKFLNKFTDNKILEILFYSKNIYPKLDKINYVSFKKTVQENELPNIFHSSNCGIVSLNRNLFSSNIPGKFVSYTQFGLPILCFANKKSKISRLINENECGIVIDYKDDIGINIEKIKSFCKKIKSNNNIYSKNSKILHEKLFDIIQVKKQIGSLFDDI